MMDDVLANVTRERDALLAEREAVLADRQFEWDRRLAAEARERALVEALERIRERAEDGLAPDVALTDIYHTADRVLADKGEGGQ